MNTAGSKLRQLSERGERIFSAHPLVAHYFPSAAIENARKRIVRAIDRGDGPALVVGAAGTGKSLLLQALAAQYRERFDIVLLACANICTRRALLQSILFELGLPYQQRDEGQLRLSLLDHLLSTEQIPTGLLMLVDEAQSLSLALLDELRVMTNLVHAGVPRVRLVLAGSSALEENFADPQLESFSQRLATRCYLSPFSREESTQFIRAQLARARVEPESVFASDSWNAVFDATDGVPRLINQLCDRALLLAGEQNRPIVDQEIVQAAWADLQQLPMPWDSPQKASTAAPASQTIEFGSLSASPSIRPVPDEIEPTELDVDDEAVICAAETIPWHATQSVSPPPAADPSPRRQRPPRDPADPFAEDFDDVEIVLDHFSAWDEIFLRQLPRVDNLRDNGLSSLVDAAAAANSAPELNANHLELEIDQEDSGNDEPVVEIVDFAEIDAAEASATPDESPTNWPRLRIADLPESAAPEFCIPTDSGSAQPDAASPSHVEALLNAESPILIIDDESPPTIPSAPAVRRLAYQHLFSRLRSG